MKYFTLSLLFGLLCLGTTHATNVPSNIASDFTLDISGSPWTVGTSVTVQSGATLYVDPGVVVEFNSSRSMTIHGSLMANSATFTAAGGNTTPGYWSSIGIQGDATFTNCIIEYADNITIGNNATALFDGTTITDFDQQGVSVVDGTSSVTMQNNCVISTSEPNTYCVYLQNGGVATLDGTTMSGATYGLYLSGQSVADLTNCNINSNTYAIYYSGLNHVTHSNTILNGNTYQSTRVQGTITLDNDTMTLDAFDYPYHFTNSITVNDDSRLEISSGNIVKFGSGDGLYIYGQFIADAATGEEIIFTSDKDDNAGGDTNGDEQATAPAVGNWPGIIFYEDSDDASNVMRRCTVRYTSSSAYGAVRALSASPTIDSCSFSHNYYGIQCTEGANPVISNCDFATSSYTPIAIDLNSNPAFTNNTFSFSDNTYDAIGLLGGVMTKSSTLPKRSVTGVPNVTYVLLSSLRITDSVELTIDPGVVIKPLSSSYNIRVQGKLVADGTMAEPIVFTSIKDDNYGQPMDTNKDGSATAPAPGNWGGLIFDADSDSTSLLDHCLFQYGRTNYQYTTSYYTRSSNVAVIKSNPDITNCTFTNADHGVSCYNTASPLIEDSDFINSSVTPIAVTANSDPTINNVTFTNAGRSAIGLIGNRVSANGTIRKKDMGGYTNIVYLLIGDLIIDAGTYIDVEPGIVIKCQSSSDIRVEGGFRAIGTAADPIIFTSEKDDKRWKSHGYQRRW